MNTGTGNNTASLGSVEDVTIRWGVDFKDCLRTYYSSTSQTPDGWTVGTNGTNWYVHNVGIIKGTTTHFWRHPVEEGYEITTTLKFVRATVDGVHYGFAAIFGGSQ